jgi:glycosyltransferase involved in cell wall biosynthesis
MSRILYLSRAPIPSYEANATQVMKMCGAMAALGHEVELVAQEGPVRADPFAFYGVKQTFSLRRFSVEKGTGNQGSLRAALALCRQLKGPDLIYARDPFLAALWPSLQPIHYEAHTLPRGLRAMAEWWLWRRPNLQRWVCISEGLANATQQRFKSGWDRIVVAPTALDRPEYSTAPLAHSLPLPRRREGALRLGYFGNAHPGKGAGWVAHLASKMPKHDFIASVGRGKERAALVAAALSTPNFHLLPPQAPARSREFCTAMDVLLAPYGPEVHSNAGHDITRWMSPLKIPEYLAAGRPIIATPHPAYAGLLVDGQNAHLVQGHTLPAWKEAIALTEKPDHRAHLGKEALALARAQPDWTGRAERVLAGGLP